MSTFVADGVTYQVRTVFGPDHPLTPPRDEDERTLCRLGVRKDDEPETAERWVRGSISWEAWYAARKHAPSYDYVPAYYVAMIKRRIREILAEDPRKTFDLHVSTYEALRDVLDAR